VIAVLAEPGRERVTAELLGAGTALADDIGGAVHVLRPAGPGAALPFAASIDPAPLASAGADVVVVLHAASRAGDPVAGADVAGADVPGTARSEGMTAEDVAAAVTDYVREKAPWALLAPSTAFGREVAGRAAAATGSGLVGDAVALSARDDRLVAAKPAFAGALVADITCRSATQMATIRPGVLPAPVPQQRSAASEVPVRTQVVAPRARVRVLGERRDDDVEILARARVVVGVGTGVAPEEYETLSPLCAVLGAELAATRKVTDKGWAPRARQVGITGRSIAPRLYVAIGLSGKFNHMVGVRAAGTILAVNPDPSAPVFEHCDIGIVGDWRDAVPLLQEALRRHRARLDAAPVS
jgi:electron transfer flavoprotein alpha subunit